MQLTLAYGPSDLRAQHAACQRGQHGRLMDGEPIDHGEAINVDHFCSACGLLVSLTSWTKAAWLEHQAKAERRAQARRSA